MPEASYDRPTNEQIVEMRIFEDNIFQPRALSSDLPAYRKRVYLFHNPLIKGEVSPKFAVISKPKNV